MPVTLREKRRSLHLATSAGKFSELAKEVAMRPQSWYLASSSIELDPYTSVRKIFYEFPKKAFYGEHGNEKKDEIFSNSHTTSEKEEPLEKDKKSLDRSFINLKSPSPVPSVKSLKNEGSDNNNNLSPSNSVATNGPSSSVKSNILNILSQKNELKEESSSYADFYVPNAAKTSQNFLRRSYHKRKTLENYRNGLSDNDDAISVTSFISASSCKLITNHKSCDFSRLRNNDKLSEKLGSDNVFFSDNEVSPRNSHVKKAPPSKLEPDSIDGSQNGNPIMERFLRDANDEDICKGVYPTADDTESFPHNRIISTLKLANKENFVPWSKRLSFIDAKLIENPPDLKATTFNSRRNSRRFSSLRFYKNKRDESDEQINPHRRLSQGYENTTIRSNRGFTSLRRHHSESGTTSRKNKMSSTLSLYREENGSLSRSLLNRSLRLRKSGKIEAREFFQGYEDKLRDRMFTVDTDLNDCKTTSSLYGVYDYISRAFEAKLLGKTYQQLFYLRSRLTLKAQKSSFLCDGYFGCGCEVASDKLNLI